MECCVEQRTVHMYLESSSSLPALRTRGCGGSKNCEKSGRDLWTVEPWSESDCN